MANRSRSTNPHIQAREANVRRSTFSHILEDEAQWLGRLEDEARDRRESELLQEFEAVRAQQVDDLLDAVESTEEQRIGSDAWRQRVEELRDINRYPQSILRRRPGLAISYSPPTSHDSVEVNFGTKAPTYTIPPGWWKMKDGKFISIKRMEESHIQNVIKMFLKNPKFDPNRRSTYSRVYREMTKELERRNKDKPKRRLRIK